MAHVALGITGGIGAYKAVEIARGLQKRGHDVTAIMTRHAREFVGPLTFEAITRRPVITDQYAPGTNAGIEHIALASEATVLAVAPATANTLAKFAHGVADDFLSSLYLATRAVVVMAPAMNTQMLEHPAVQANLDVLARRGVKFVEPGEGYLACGWVGKGRLAEPEDVIDAVHYWATRSGALAGVHVVVTAGPTYEDLDPVRFIGNRSSGRMGFAVAEEAARRGATVTLIHGPGSTRAPYAVSRVAVRSAADMHAAVMAAYDRADVVVMAAAVADYTPSNVADQKIAKQDRTFDLPLVRTADILAALGAKRGGAARPLLIGFAAETHDVLEHAREKLRRKKVDFIVANDVSRADAGFDVSTNAGWLVSATGTTTAWPLEDKGAMAARILDTIEGALTPPVADPAEALR